MNLKPPDGLTEEQQKAWLGHAGAAMLREGDSLDPEQLAAAEFGKAPPAPAPHANGNGRAPEGVFTERDLTGEELHNYEEYRMPNGKKVFIFAASGADAHEIAYESISLTPQTHPRDSEATKAMKEFAFQVDLWSLTVIACCRTGPERTAPRCFSFTAREKVMKYLAADVIQEIAKIAERLGKNQDPGKEKMTAFFQRVWTFCGKLASASSIGKRSLPGLQTEATEIALECSLWNARNAGSTTPPASATGQSGT